MIRKLTLLGICFVLLLVIGTAQGEAEELTRKKLQVFILAGQSNMVGHANFTAETKTPDFSDPQ